MTRPRRVVHVLATLEPGGAERLATHLVCALDRERFEPGVVLLYDRVGSDLEERLDRSDIPIRSLGKPGPGARPATLASAYRALRDLEPEILHTHGYPLAYVLPAWWARRVPAGVHTVHTEATKESGRRSSRWIHRLAFSLGVQPVFASESIRRSFEAVYPHRHGTVIENGIPIEAFGTTDPASWRAAEGYLPEDRLAVFVGRLEAVKRPVELVEAFGAVARADPRARLLLVGDGSQRPGVEEAIERGGLSTAVRLAGFRTDIPEVLAAADVVVLNSEYEGLPLAVLEAMASGVPVVAPRVGGLPDVVEGSHAGRLFSPGDPAGLADVLVALLGDPEERHRLGRAGRAAAVARFSVAAMARRYEALYERLLARRDGEGAA